MGGDRYKLTMYTSVTTTFSEPGALPFVPSTYQRLFLAAIAKQRKRFVYSQESSWMLVALAPGDCCTKTRKDGKNKLPCGDCCNVFGQVVFYPSSFSAFCYYLSLCRRYVTRTAITMREEVPLGRSITRTQIPRPTKLSCLRASNKKVLDVYTTASFETLIEQKAK